VFQNDLVTIISFRDHQIIPFIGLFKLLFSATITKYCRCGFDPFGRRQFFLNEQQIISILTSFKYFLALQFTNICEF
jgi:hypothetical protein